MATRRSNDSQRTSKTTSSVTPREAEPAASPAAQSKRPSRRRTTTSANNQSPSADRVNVPPEARRAMIAEAAYLRAERRGFATGFETEDWLAAESEVDALLSAGPGGAQ